MTNKIINSCDGCQQGLPVQQWKNPISGKIVPVHMAGNDEVHLFCTKDRYQEDCPCGVLRSDCNLHSPLLPEKKDVCKSHPECSHNTNGRDMNKPCCIAFPKDAENNNLQKQSFVHFCEKCEWGDFPERCKDNDEPDYEAEERQFLKDVYKGTIFGEGKDNCCSSPHRDSEEWEEKVTFKLSHLATCIHDAEIEKDISEIKSFIRSLLTQARIDSWKEGHDEAIDDLQELWIDKVRQEAQKEGEKHGWKEGQLHGEAVGRQQERARIVKIVEKMNKLYCFGTSTPHVKIEELLNLITKEEDK